MTRPAAAIDGRMLLGAMLLSFVFGSLHAFGVLLDPLQQLFGSGRAIVSLGYSLAIASLTVGVLLGGRLPRGTSPRHLALFCGAASAGGLAVAASQQSLITFLIGYGLMFGVANGLAYGLFLDRAAHALPGARGFATGVVTAVYGAGAAAFAQMLAVAINAGSPASALWMMALSTGLAAVLAGALFPSAAPALSVKEPRAGSGYSRLWPLWLIYFLGALGGLMVIAHAAAIMTDRGAAAGLAQLAPALNAVGNIAGSLLGGAWADRTAPGRALAVPLAMTATAMVLLLFTTSGLTTLSLLSLCGFAYGALIAVVPVVVRARHGAASFNRNFGIVFTAWGAAGLAGPLLAGALHDASGKYDLAIAVSIASALAALALSQSPSGRLTGAERI